MTQKYFKNEKWEKESKMGVSIISIIVSFCAGLFGTLIGALNAFIIFGLVLIFGIVLNIVSVMTGAVGYDWINQIAFGPYFAPFITFLGGAVAAMYASKKGYIESGKQIEIPLITVGKVDVYCVGGLFGVIGYLFSTYITTPFLGDKIDGGAFTIIIISLIAKFLFEGNVIGKVPEQDKRLGGRFSLKVTNVWQPGQRALWDKIFLGTAVGAVSGLATYSMFTFGVNSYVAAYFGFAISTFSLIYINLGIPVTHHISVCAGYAIVALLLENPNLSVEVCLVWGIAFAILATFLGDILGSLFYVYGDSHIDPPGLAIMVVSFLAMYGIRTFRLYETGVVIPVIGIAAVVLFAAYRSLTVRKNNETVVNEI